MTGRFMAGVKYSGKTIFGGCGQMDFHMVTILKRTKGYITCKDRWGTVLRVRRKYATRYEYFTTRVDSFYAYAVEPD